jgi:hypothetical protein
MTITPAMRMAAMAEALREVTKQSRQPFRRLLADLIGAAPEPEALTAFAQRYPDKWAQALSIMAGLAGYEKGLVELNLFNIGGLSDAQVLARLDADEAELVKLGLRRAAASAEVLSPVSELKHGSADAPLISGDSVRENGWEAPRPAAESAEGLEHDGQN